MIPAGSLLPQQPAAEDGVRAEGTEAGAAANAGPVPLECPQRVGAVVKHRPGKRRAAASKLEGGAAAAVLQLSIQPELPWGAGASSSGICQPIPVSLYLPQGSAYDATTAAAPQQQQLQILPPCTELSNSSSQTCSGSVPMASKGFQADGRDASAAGPLDWIPLQVNDCQGRGGGGPGLDPAEKG